jgi:hypothetical protein
VGAPKAQEDPAGAQEDPAGAANLALPFERFQYNKFTIYKNY